LAGGRGFFCPNSPDWAALPKEKPPEDRLKFIAPTRELEGETAENLSGVRSRKSVCDKGWHYPDARAANVYNLSHP